MAIEQFIPYHPLWTGFVEHLRKVDMAQGVLESELTTQPGLYCLGSVIDNRVIGHITFKMQLIAFPSIETDDTSPSPLRARDGRPLRETFVQTFAVDPAFRRNGYGRALQLAALEMTKTLGCHQMRSWSSADKRANHALKLSLGFSAHPAVQVAADGRTISGVYFVKAV